MSHDFRFHISRKWRYRFYEVSARSILIAWACPAGPTDVSFEETIKIYSPKIIKVNTINNLIKLNNRLFIPRLNFRSKSILLSPDLGIISLLELNHCQPSCKLMLPQFKSKGFFHNVMHQLELKNLIVL